MEALLRTKLRFHGLGDPESLPRDSVLKSWSLEFQKDTLLEAKLLGAPAVSHVSLSEPTVHIAWLQSFASYKAQWRLLSWSVGQAPAERGIHLPPPVIL